MLQDKKVNEMRRQAVEKLNAKAPATEHLSNAEISTVVHELHVHQIELEMQNEELRSAQEQLQKSRLEYTELFDFAPVGYVVISRDKTISKINLTATSLLGVARSNVIGRPFCDFVKRDQLDEWFLHTRKLLVHGQKESIELQMLNANQAPINTCLKSEPVFDSDGNITEGRIAIVDITLLKQAELLVAAHGELETQARQLTASNADLTKRTVQLSKLTTTLTDTEQRERKRLAKILHDNLQQLLVAAKLSVGAILSNTQDEMLQTCAKETCALLDESVRTTRSLSVDLCPPVLQERGLIDSLKWLCRWIQQTYKLSVILNAAQDADMDCESIKFLVFEAVRELLFNIVKHAGVREAAIQVKRFDDCIQIIVSDTGAGFEPSRVQQNTEKVGFGLFSIRERLAFYDGTLNIESSPGKGATFTITLPLNLELASAVAKTAGVPASKALVTSQKPETGTTRVLLVDDHTVMRKGLAALFRREPDIVVAGEAADGRQAIEKAHELQPDVILMDYNMPNLNGVEATRVIHAELPNIRIIGLSMYEEAELAAGMVKAGASAFLNKAGAVEELLKEIRAKTCKATKAG